MTIWYSVGIYFYDIEKKDHVHTVTNNENKVYYSVILLKEAPHKILNKYTQKYEIKLGPKCLRG